MLKPLPSFAKEFVGETVVWREDRPTVIEGEAFLLPTEEAGLVVGARWARNVDNKPFGQEVGAVQFLMERPDGTTRWTPPVDAS